MNREEKKNVTGPIKTEQPLSQGLVEQAYVQAQTLNQDLEEVGTAYSELNTGACATNPGLCAEHPQQRTGSGETTIDKLQKKARKASSTYADTMRRWTAAFRNYSVDDLTHEVQLFARQHPALVIGGAVIAGFALTRVIKITGDSTRTERGYDSEPSYERTSGKDILPAEEEVFHS